MPLSLEFTGYIVHQTPGVNLGLRHERYLCYCVAFDLHLGLVVEAFMLDDTLAWLRPTLVFPVNVFFRSVREPLRRSLPKCIQRYCCMVSKMTFVVYSSVV